MDENYYWVNRGDGWEPASLVEGEWFILGNPHAWEGSDWLIGPALVTPDGGQ